MKRTIRILALLLCVVMAFSIVACGKKNDDPQETTTNNGGNTPSTPANDTLVVGYDLFSEKFSPFFATTAYDQDVAGMTQVGLLTTDREGNVIMNGIEGETHKFNGKDYLYTGIADCEIVKNSDGTLTYKFKLREDVKFSDGTNLTADDVIFTMYVLSDPLYDGSSTFYAQPIVGMTEYRSDRGILSNLILAAGPGATKDYFTAEQAEYYWNAFNTAGVKFAKGILDDIITYYGEDYNVSDYAGAAALWGYEATTEVEFWNAFIDTHGYNLANIDKEAFSESIFDLVDAELGDRAAEYAEVVMTGAAVNNIPGIKKTGTYSLEVTMTKFDATSIYQLGVSVTPLHYYGSKAAYNYDANQFGFTKGDLSGIKAKTTAPMGAGAYKFIEYANGVVRFERNEYYFKGAPKIKYINFQETSAGNKFAGVQAGTFDITDPSFDTATVDAIKEANGGNLNGNVVTTFTVDNLGYGYLGICANTVNVGGVKNSEASKNLRKAFATLFSVYRETAIDSYYGDRASVINYPISNTSWAAPKPADEGYEIAYAKDVNGDAIYTANMTEEEKYAAALAAAVDFLKAAGFTYDGSKFTAAPEGAKLEYTAIIPADGIGDHPSYAILTSTKAALETVGITLNINDPSDSNELWNALDAGECEIWAAAWGATIDPDMYQVYHSSNIVGLEGSTESNHYSITDADLDQLIMEARESDDQAFRKATYKECLEIILDWGVEIPVYQRQNAIIASTARVNISTLTPDITTYWGWMNDIEKLEMN